MFKIVHTVYYNAKEDRLSGLEFYSTQPDFNEQLVQQIKQQFQNQGPLLVIDAQAVLPPFWQTRLLQAMVDNEEINQVCALSVNQHELSPISDDFAGTMTQLDQAVYLLQPPQYFLSKTINKACFAVRNTTFLSAADCYAVNNLVVDASPSEQQLLVALTPPDIGDQHPLPAHPLAALQLKLKSVEANNISTGYPGLDTKPVVLHTVMDWGGGVHQWVNDFIQNHDEFHHLVLSSQGEFYRQQQGERFQLTWQNTAGLKLEEFHLTAAIKATTEHDPHYLTMINAIIKRWDVQQLVVSSLIGHAMDCLNTSLPTLRILHDYFPHWPSLNAQLDATVIDQNNLNQALLDTQAEPFGEITLAELTSWQQAHNKRLNAKHVSIVAPDESVKINLLKLPHSSSFEKTQIIPHAIRTLKPIGYQAEQTPFKVLVLGRISPPKGLQLLHQCIHSMVKNEAVEFVLLGAGLKGQEFEKYPNTQVIADYHQLELTQKLTEVSPQMALLTSVTAETFSYTLSELQMSGIPVLATAVGAFKNRIEDDVDGVLVAAKAELITAKIVQLQNNPERLLQLHQGALKATHFSIKQNKTAFSDLLELRPSRLKAYQTDGLVTPSPVAQILQTKQSLIQRLNQTLEVTELNLLEKTQWAKQLTTQNKHLTDNINLDRKEIKHLKAAVDEQSITHAAETNNLKQEIDQISSHLSHVNEELAETLLLRDQLTQEKAELSQTLHDVETSLSQSQSMITAMQNSRSWRVTQPLRAFTTYARHKRNAVKFRFKQLRSWPKRLITSLKSRGLKQTAVMAKNKFNKPKPQATATAHQVTQNYQAFTIDTSHSPKVTVVIPVYNQFKHTYHCLQSLARLADTTEFEVIVVDDCSTDETAELIHNISGIRYQRQSKNGGFIESCNTGAKLANGQYLLFLNNDTEVLSGWLDELMLTFEQQPEAGLVGSQLLYPDGRLQEAGGIVFNDASGWNYGRLDAPEAPEYQHLREATYISGASIMIAKHLFIQLGYFDQRYKPAYYEDTDLAFAVRQAGLKVFYQPLSQVIHFEGISSGTDLTSGTKKYQVINQQKFAEKWQTELKSQPAPGSDIELARFQNQPPRVLIFDACTPTPDQDSGSLRMINLMKIFNQLGYQVSFVPENMAYFKNYTLDLQRMGVECVYAPKYASPLDYLKAKGAYFQTVILSRYYVAEPLMPMIRSYCSSAKLWFDTVDLHYLRETRMAELEKDLNALKAAKQTKLKELGVAQNCDLTLVVSPYEQKVLATERPDLDVAVLSNIHQVYGGHQGYEKSKDILFIGGYQHTPNVDGVLWLVNEILPQILKSIPDLKLHIVGSKAPKAVIELGNHPQVEFHGFVEDIEPLMQTIRIAVAPLRFGAGVKGKVNMSMSYGQPVVGTKVAVEGMYTQHGHDVMMADQVEGFAAAVINLYQDQKLWERVSKGGLENVQKWFSFEAAQQTIAELLQKS